MEQNAFLAKEKLDTLTNCVGRLFSNLNSSIDSAPSIWTNPIRMAQNIESNALAVNSVVLEARKFDNYLNGSSSNPKLYNIILTRVYILLKYKHHDNILFQKAVFPILIADMGPYGGKDNLTKIDNKIEEIIDIDNLAKRTTQDVINKNNSPMFTTPKFSKGQWDAFFHIFTKERLFREMEPVLKSLCEEYGIAPDIALVWYMGRDIVLKLWNVEFPESYINRILDNLSHEKGFASSPIVDLYMIAAFSIMQTVTNSDHFKNAISKIVKMSTDNDNEHSLIRDNILEITQFTDQIRPITDFDYTVNKLPDITIDTVYPENMESNFKVQIAEKDRLIKEKDKKISLLEEQLKELEGQLCFSDKELEGDKESDIEFLKTELPEITIDGLSKFRLEIVYQLLEISGINMSPTFNYKKDGKKVRKNIGTKKHAAIIAEFVTGLGESTCKNHCTDRKCTNSKLNDNAINTLNVIKNSIEELKIDIKL